MARTCIVLLAGCLVVVPARGADGPSASDRRLVERVTTRLAAAATPPTDVAWPPAVHLEDKGSRIVVTLARKGDDRPRPRLRVPSAVLSRLVQGEADALAYLLAHEMAHVLLRHPLRSNDREKQHYLAADRAAVELLLRAGFSFRKARRALLRGDPPDSLVAHRGNPPPTARQRLAALDRAFAEGWHAMPAYHEGLVFLATQRYPLAEICFERVVDEFPGCGTTWGWLGHARLVQYCDSLTASDVRGLGVGQPHSDGFCRRLPWLEPALRGKQRRLWWRASEALHEALRQKPGWRWLRAQLALAYLVHPDGKDLGEALPLLEEAARDMDRDPALLPHERASIHINLAVAFQAAARYAQAAGQLNDVDALVRRHPSVQATAGLTAALRYNRARLLASSHATADLTRARDLLLRYLRESSPSSAWWPLAHEDYRKLCTRLKTQPQSRQQLQRRRPALTVRLASTGAAVRPGESVTAVVRRLGTPHVQTILGSTNLRRLRFARHGVEVVATDAVLAVCLTQSTSPALVVGDSVDRVCVGMTLADLQRLTSRPEPSWSVASVMSSRLFYPEQGIAVRLAGGKVAEVTLVEVKGNEKER
jgi:hypothetical protein